MRLCLFVILTAALLCGACNKKGELFPDYAIQNAAESDGDLHEPAQ
ncbi:MAG TPA: hypothetical protein P5077_00585 [bacterium]|nr:hypothetical protein [bacterium]